MPEFVIGRQSLIRAILAVAGSLSMLTLTAAADEPAKSKSGLKLVTPDEPKEKAQDIYAIPDGTPEQILEFLEALQKRRMRFSSREEAIGHAIKVQRAIIAAGDKILQMKMVSDDDAYAAGQMKLEALGLLASAEIDGAMDEALKAADALSKDKRKELAELGQEWYRNLRVMSAPGLDDAGRQALIAEILEGVRTNKFSRESLGAAVQLGEALESHPDTTVAGKYYADLAQLIETEGNKGLADLAEVLKASSRRFQLPGQEIEVTGTTLAGEPFDFKKYRGKVVLVDFWATWCGPCVEEIPNVKANYEKYHAKGFDVVGISLDDNKDLLKEFIEENKLPWTNLFAPEKDGEPGEQPTARYYNITGIPTAILVDREGKVISLNARGEALTELLEKEFPADKQ